MRKDRMSFLIVFMTILLTGRNLLAQPYTFYTKGFGENFDNVYRLDLSNGSSEMWADSIPNCQGLTVDQTDQWVYINYGQRGAYMMIVNANNPSKVFYPLVERTDVRGFAGIIYVPQANKFYVTWLMPDTLRGGEISETTIFDAATFKNLGNIDFGFSYSDQVSPDGRYIYQYANDSLGRMDLYTFSTATNSVVSKTPMINVGPATPDKAVEAGVYNRLLLGWAHPNDHSAENAFYSVYDIETQSNLPSINFPLICDAYLSADGNNIILNRWEWIDTTANTGQRYFPGTVYVFNANTGQLTQRLSLPPNGKILVIDSSPKMFYYYNGSTNQAIAVSDTVVTPTNALIDTLISLKHQAAANGWLRDDRNRGHDIDEMMRGNEWYNEMEGRKFRSWEVGKDWQFDHDWNEGIVEVLDRRLDMAKRALDRGDSVMARRNLEILVLEVELLNNLSTRLVKRGEEPVITSQGYLSLKFNAEYVIDRLPERSDKEHGGGRRDKR